MVLGFRNSTKKIRYALILSDGDNHSISNANSENKLTIPRVYSSDGQKLAWYYQEVSRIIDHNPGISTIACKAHDVGVRDSYKSRFVFGLDAILVLIAQQRGMQFKSFIKSGLGLKGMSVEDVASSMVDALPSQWDQQMAEATLAGLRAQ